jgi:hypothetical protein
MSLLESRSNSKPSKKPTDEAEEAEQSASDCSENATGK